jgi:hypothetical protein
MDKVDKCDIQILELLVKGAVLITATGTSRSALNIAETAKSEGH